MPFGVDERGDEEERRMRRAPPSSPFEAGLRERLGHEHDRRGRDDDPVRDDPVLDVDRRDRDEDDAEERRDDRLGREPEPQHRSRDEQGGDELDDGVAQRDARRSQCRQRPRSSAQERSGMLSYAAISCQQLMQAERRR